MRSNARGDVVLKLETQDSSHCEFARGCAERITVWTGDIRGRFAAPAVLTDHGATNAGFALGPAGDVAVAWNDFVSGPGDVLVARRAPGGSFGAAQTLASSQLTTPRVAVDGKGRAVSVFAAFAAPQIRVFAAARGAALAERPSIDTGVRSTEAGVTLAPSGAGVVYWSSGSTCVCAPLYGRFGTGWATYPRAVQFAGGAGGDFLAGPGDNLVAYWVKQRDSRSSVFEPYAAVGTAARGFGRKQRLAQRGGVEDAAIDRRGRATVLAAPYVVQIGDGKRLRRIRLPAPGSFAMSPNGTILIGAMSGSFPNQRVRAYWR
jgi:hypothetical protein